MPTELIKRINLDLLYPVFTQKWLEVLAACQKRGHTYYAISGTRTVQEQNELFAQGRIKPGPIVTKAKGGQSYHNFGIAGDSCKDADTKRSGLQPDWNKESYKVLAEEAGKQGLEAGLLWPTFPDAPHIQLPLKKWNIKLETLRRIEAKSGLKGVFDFLDEFKW
jgi:peptidoglycan LD-endopeptidase CwlK